MSRPRVSLTVAGSPARSSTFLNASMAPREDPSNAPVGLYGIRLTLNDVRVEQRRERARVFDAVVDSGEHHVLDEDLAASELDVAPAFGEHVRRADSDRSRA